MPLNFTIQQLNTLTKCNTWNAVFYTTFDKHLNRVLTTDKVVLVNELNMMLPIIRPFLTVNQVKESVNRAISNTDILKIEKILSEESLNLVLLLPRDEYIRITTIFDYILTSEKYLNLAKNSYEAIEKELEIKLANLKNAKTYLFKF